MKKTIIAAMILMFLTLTSFASVAKCDCECDEFFYDVYTIVWDDDEDGCNDHIQVYMDVDTCVDACVHVHVAASLLGPDSMEYDSAMPDWEVCGEERDPRDIVFFVPPGAPTGWYDVELTLYDNCGEEDYMLIEDVIYGAECCCDEFFYDVYTIVWDDDEDGCNDHIQVYMDVNTCLNAGVDVHVLASLLGPDSMEYDSAMPEWTVYGDDPSPRDIVFFVPPGAPTGWYDVELTLYDNCGEEDYMLIEDALLHCIPSPTIETCNDLGVLKDEFNPSEDVYVVGDGFPAPSAPTTYPVYVVADVDWSSPMSIPSRIPGTVETITVDSSGNIDPSPTLIWSGAVPGEYDIIVDVDDNHEYNENTDALDDLDVNDAGFLVIPEFLGTILGLAACFVAFGVFHISKRRH